MKNAKYQVTVRQMKANEPENPKTGIMTMTKIASRWPDLALLMIKEPHALMVKIGDERIDMEWYDHGQEPRARRDMGQQGRAATKKGEALIKSMAEFMGKIAAQALSDLFCGRLSWGAIDDLTMIHNKVQDAWGFFK